MKATIAQIVAIALILSLAPSVWWSALALGVGWLIFPRPEISGVVWDMAVELLKDRGWLK